MITLLLLTLIYIAFISLGLPDSLLGVSWPAMQLEWGMSLDAAGLISIFITGGTIISSLLSGRIIRLIGTGKLTFISCLLTGTALLSMSYAPSYIWLVILAIPLGFGAGSVDAALNNYVALHFKAHHMNWLHSFWGIGATIGPLIMAKTLLDEGSWRGGYRIISIVQLSLALLLMLSLSLWAKHAALSNSPDLTPDSSIGYKEKNVFKLKGVKYALATFSFYCAVEVAIGLWGSSYLMQIKGLSIEKAASWIAIYYGSITVGRFISGFISFKLNNTQMIRIGITTALIGVVLLLFPLPEYLLFIAFIFIGLGLSPIFPAMIHETPKRFGKVYSQDIIGYQMAFAYIGTGTLPPLFGFIVKYTNMGLFPIYLILCMLVIVYCTQWLAKLNNKRNKLNL